jgi:hypothetical protein
MQSDQTPLASSFKRLLSSDQSVYQITVREQLAALNRDITEKLKQQPTFHGFVQAQLKQAFPALAQGIDPRKIFITPSTTGTDSTTPAPAPHVLDAVVRRIVEQQPADYAARQMRFERPTKVGDETLELCTITAAQFDTFLDQLAGELDSRYATYLQAFLQASVGLTDTRSRKQWLVDQRAEQVRLEAQLLKADDLLSDGAYVLLTKVLRYRDALARRQNLLGYRPCVYSLELAGEGAAPHLALPGALVMTARDPDHSLVWSQGQEPAPSVRPLKADADVGTVVLFTPTQGLECFASLALLDQELHRRLKLPAEFPGLLMLVAQHDQARAYGRHVEAKTQGQLRYGELNASAFAESVEAQCRRLRKDFSAQVEAYRSRGVSGSMGDLPASLDRVTDLTRLFGLDSLLQARELKRVAKNLSDFLAPASTSDRTAWRQALERYRNVLDEAPEWVALPSLQQFGDTAQLLAYSNEQLRLALEAEYGLAVDPDQIMVTTQEPRKPTGAYAPGAPPLVPEGPRYTTRKRTLSELALENVGGIDLNFVNFSTLTDLQGEPYSALSAGQVKDLVRSVNIGEQYPEFLKHRLLTSPEALAQKTSYASVAAMQMRLDALEAKIAGDFLADRLDRGFQWVNSVLDHPQETADRRDVEGHGIRVHGLQIKGLRVRGVMVFGTASQAVKSLVVYLPEAPGGRVFYEFEDSVELRQRLIDHPSWHDYLVNRVALQDQASLRSTLRSGVGDAMVALPRITANVLMEAYELEASAAISAAMHLTTSTHETNIRTASTLVEWSLDILTLVLPVKVTLVIGMARSLFSLVRGIQAAEAGERELAAHSFVRAFGELVGAAADGIVGSVPRPLRAGLDSNMAVGTKPAGLAPLPGWEQHGIYTQQPREGGFARHFLEQDGHWYSIKYDPDFVGWRLRDARKPFAYHLAPLRRDSLGVYAIASPAFGLKGGYPAEQTLMDAFPYLTRSGARRVLDSFSFPQGRVLELELELAREMSAWADIPTRFHEYLNQPLDQIRMWLNGYEVFATQPAVAGPSRAPVLPSTSQPFQPRLPQQWLDWGRAISAAQVTPHPSRPHTFTISDPRAALRGDAIQIGSAYYPVLPRGANCPDTLVHLYDPNQSPLSFTNFYDRGAFKFKRQPRIANFDRATGQWQVDETPLLFAEANHFLFELFPMISVVSRKKLARTLFERLNPDDVVTSGGLRAFLNHLHTWRSALNRGPDPLQFLSSTPRAQAGSIKLDGFSAEFWKVSVGIRGLDTLGLTLTASLEIAALREVLGKLVTAMGFQLIGSGGPGPELLFRWSPQSTVYCLRIHPNLVGQTPTSIRPLVSGMDLSILDAATHAVVAQSQANSDFVTLYAGAVFRGGLANIYILKP